MSDDILHLYEGLLKEAQADLEKNAILRRATGAISDALGVGSEGHMRRGLRALADEADAADFGDDVMRMAAQWGIDPAEAQRVMRMPDFPGRQAARGSAEAANTTGEAANASRKGLGPLGVAGLVGAGGLGAAGTYHIGRSRGEEEGQRRRNLAFGAGLATGAVAPKLLGQVGSGLQALGGQMQNTLGPAPRHGAGGYSPEQIQNLRAMQLQRSSQGGYQ